MSKKSIWLATIIFLATGSLAQAQKPKKFYRIGYITNRSEIGRNEEAFRKRLHELGYVEGLNSVIDWRFTSGKTSLISDFAADLVRLNVDAIVAQGVAPTRAAKQASSTIPIVMGNTDGDPVRLGLIASLRAQAETSLASPAYRRSWPASGWNFSKRPFQERCEWRFSRDRRAKATLPLVMSKRPKLQRARWGSSFNHWRCAVPKNWQTLFAPRESSKPERS
jgi:hypothetical protein